MFTVIVRELVTSGYDVLSFAHCRHNKIYMHSKSVYFTQNSPFGGMSFVGLCAFRKLVRHRYLLKNFD